jgi:hypothetical protein
MAGGNKSNSLKSKKRKAQARANERVKAVAKRTAYRR